MTDRLSTQELIDLVERVFQPRPGEQGLAVMVDLPDSESEDTDDWRVRRETAREWTEQLASRRQTLGFDTHLVLYPNIHTDNGELPQRAWLHRQGPLPARAESLVTGDSLALAEIYSAHSLIMALTQFSSTAPLKVAARRYPIRAATMPGFRADMIPALRLDYREVNRRVGILEDLLNRASGANLRFRHPGGEAELYLDLRWRTAHASGGLLPSPGLAGNLPSGEAYVAPYEGEREGEPSRSAGVLPVQFGSEVVLYRVERNRAVAVISQGLRASQEAALLAQEPAYGNLAELGLGVLAALGVKPIGETLLDEKLGLHLAFGRSDHLGGQVGPEQFSRPEAVIHIDRVYVPETQPDVQVVSLDLSMAEGSPRPLMRNGSYVVDFS